MSSEKKTAKPTRKPDKALRTILERAAAQGFLEIEGIGDRRCHGECSGTGFYFLLIPGKCPKPCDPKKLAEVEREAKRRAKKEADDMCIDRGGPACLCNGRYTKLLLDCCTTDFAGLGDYCFYYALYQYLGKCDEAI